MQELLRLPQELIVACAKLLSLRSELLAPQIQRPHHAHQQAPVSAGQNFTVLRFPFVHVLNPRHFSLQHRFQQPVNLLLGEDMLHPRHKRGIIHRYIDRGAFTIDRLEDIILRLCSADLHFLYLGDPANTLRSV